MMFDNFIWLVMQHQDPSDGAHAASRLYPMWIQVKAGSFGVGISFTMLYSFPSADDGTASLKVTSWS